MTPLPLSVCLIARDEAHNLPGLMASLAGVAQEVIIVDTGSVDGTPALATSLGARVLHSAWQDDFSQARNVALKAAQAPWILSMDADQQLDAGAAQALAVAIQRQDSLAQLVTIRLLGPADANGSTQVVRNLPSLRLFRRDARISYRGRVHEDVAASLLEIGSHSWPDSGVTVTDHGYMEPEARARKLARNLRLLRQAHQERPDDLHLAYKLASSLPPEAAMERKGVLWGALRQAQTMPDESLLELTCLPRLVAAGLEAWVDEGRLTEAADAASLLMRRSAPVLLFTCGRTLARAGLHAEGRAALMTYLKAASGIGHRPQLDLTQQDEDANPQEALRWLAWLEWMQGRTQEAWIWIDKGREFSGQPVHPPLESLAVEVLLAQGDIDAAMRRLDALGRQVGQHLSPPKALMPELMLAAARVALVTGDRPSAREFAAQALSAADDAGAVLLAQVEAADADLNREVLTSHHSTIKGRRFDTLALKLMLGQRLGLTWAHPVPEATTRAIQHGLRPH
jgi:hypothetical protein